MIGSVTPAARASCAVVARAYPCCANNAAAQSNNCSRRLAAGRRLMAGECRDYSADVEYLLTQCGWTRPHRAAVQSRDVSRTRARRFGRDVHRRIATLQARAPDRHQINPTSAQRLTPQQPPRRQPGASYRSVEAVGVEGVVAARRVKPAMPPHHRTKDDLVRPDRQQKRQRKPERPVSRQARKPDGVIAVRGFATGVTAARPRQPVPARSRGVLHWRNTGCHYGDCSPSRARRFSQTR